MKFTIQAACGCSTGKIRKNNEDNFFFDGKCLMRDHQGLRNPALLEKPLENGFSLAVFDGMGGEHFGEHASYAAARQMQAATKELDSFLISEKVFLQRLTAQLDEAVVRLQKELRSEHIGSTFVNLSFFCRYVYVCNVGDSRAYRLRDGEFLQLSSDHTEKRPGRNSEKGTLTQYLGFGSEEMEIEPYIAKGELKKDDIYLLCSDGLTDMLTNAEICGILDEAADAESCVQQLLRAALDRGGRDNITVIVCRLL